MNKMLNIVAVGILLLLLLYRVAMYGTEWEFGKHGLPVTLLAPDGCHHPNGSEVEAVTLAVARSGHEELVELIALGVLVSLVGCLIWKCGGFGRAV